MLVFLLVLAFIFFAAIAPIETTVAFLISVVATTLLIKVSTKLITHNDVGFLDALKAVGLSTVFAILAFMGLVGSTLAGVGGLSILLCIGLFFVAYIAGFSIALGTSFGQSAIIALVSSVVSGFSMTLMGI
ncbi:hypothetical protein [Halopseudomonas maritima]|uniref:hypothetical protein n=1 Tax=Halopseudomonas maritima TaxID=2918528 RepID=UPI001EECE0DA|nr:hypothetical protein [Halopseudomonas maritima]UJJ31730.1 hypothetical protein HV822_00645 [Halopseudomonas maritima]